MPFEPFGYRFDIASPMTPSDLKSAIRARKKGWFDTKNGARGWIVGPIICLWLSAFDRQGPMLFGRISEDGFGARIGGRAGSDLNGIGMFAILLPFLGYFLYDIMTSGSWSFGQVAVIGGMIVLSPLIFWWNHKDRKQAEPLVRFLRDVAAPAAARRLRPATRSGLTLTVSGVEVDEAVSPETIHAALMDMGTTDFIILQIAPEDYVQAAISEDGFVVEKREGSQLKHFRAVRRSAPEVGIFTLEETEAAFIAFASDAAMPSVLLWERMDMPDPSR